MIKTYKNGQILVDGVMKECDIVVDGEIIKEIGINKEEGQIVDCKGLSILPSFMDSHAHFRDPGFIESETLITGANAAMHGGYTTVLLMPNTCPTISTANELRSLKERIKKETKIDLIPFSTITLDEASKTLVDMDKMDTVGFSDDGKGVTSSYLMFLALKKAKELNKVISCHEEDLDLVHGGILNPSSFQKKFGYKENLDISETTMVARDLVLAKKTQGPLHICHVASKESLDLIAYYKMLGTDVSLEVTPHHLLLDTSFIKDDPSYKMNPPLRSRSDRMALIDALKKGIIDMIGTDHAPHEKKKKMTMEQSAFGITGIETAFPLLYTYLVKPGEISLNQLNKLMNENVASRFGMVPNQIKIGEKANFVCVDLEKEVTITEDFFLSKGKNSPFIGWKIQGIIEKTIYKGEMIYGK